MIILDLYVLASFRRFVRRMGWNVWISRTAWVIAGLMAVFSPYVNYLRSNQSQLEDWQYTIFVCSTVWYFPKLPIVVVLLVKDLFRALISLYKKIFSSSTTSKAQPTLEGRRAVLATAAWSTATIPFIMVARGVDLRDDITIYRETIELANLGSAFHGIRIAQISDIHAGSWRDSRPFQEARRLIEAERPDILVITGDFVNFQAEELKLIRSELEKLHADMGVYASLGNHDHYMRPAEHELLKSVIRNCGINLLVNENHVFSSGNDKLQLLSIDNTGLGQNFGDLKAAMVGLSPDQPSILLAHDPTFWEKQVVDKVGIDLTLSGHTHGGQVGLNIIGHEVSVAQFVYKHWAGLYKERDQQLYVNRGLGTIGPPLRVGIPPEITVFTLRSRVPLLG